MSLDQLLDLESIINLGIAGLFLAALLILLHPRIGGNSLKRYLVFVAAASCLTFVTSAWSLLVVDVLADLTATYWLIFARTVTKLLLPVSFGLLVYKVVRTRHSD
jgi:hypothetical protein